MTSNVDEVQLCVYIGAMYAQLAPSIAYDIPRDLRHLQ